MLTGHTVLHMTSAFQIALSTTYWTMINHAFTWGSLGLYFCILFLLCSDGMCLMFPSVFNFLGKTWPASGCRGEGLMKC